MLKTIHFIRRRHFGVIFRYELISKKRYQKKKIIAFDQKSCHRYNKIGRIRIQRKGEIQQVVLGLQRE